MIARCEHALRNKELEIAEARLEVQRAREPEMSSGQRVQSARVKLRKKKAEVAEERVRFSQSATMPCDLCPKSAMGGEKKRRLFVPSLSGRREYACVN